MDQTLLRILGGETKFYPFELENKYPRIFERILMLWDRPGMSDYFMELMVTDREDRAGFPPDVAAEIMRLSLVHASSRKPNKTPDVWDIPTESLANFRPPVSIENTGEWKPLSATMARALERFGLPNTARGFHHAAETGNQPAVALFLEARVNTEIHDERGWTPLMLAAFHGHDEVIVTLLKHNANIHASDMLGNTALHWATDAGRTSSAKLLIENHAEVNARNKSGITPLIQASIRRRLGDLLLLIDSGANPNLTTHDGSTALHIAAAEGYTEIVRTLLHCGADKNIKNLEGNLPLTLAEKHDRQAVIKMLVPNLKSGDMV